MEKLGNGLLVTVKEDQGDTPVDPYICGGSPFRRASNDLFVNGLGDLGVAEIQLELGKSLLSPDIIRRICKNGPQVVPSLIDHSLLFLKAGQRQEVCPGTDLLDRSLLVGERL